MKKEEVKELVLKCIEEGDVVNWEGETGGDEFLSINGGDPGVTLKDDGVYFFEGTEEFEKVPYSEDERIEELLTQALCIPEEKPRPCAHISLFGQDQKNLQEILEKLKPILKEAVEDENQDVSCFISLLDENTGEFIEYYLD